MPRLNGLQVVDKTRKFIETQNTIQQKVKVIDPIFIFLTAYASTSFSKHAKSQGVAHIYEKPL
jgi:CheY-like chemotaxis protein